MTPLSTLTASDLHALVAELDAAATKGPWLVEDGNEFVWCRKHGISYDICQVPDTLRRGVMPNSETDPAFIAQSRDLVPELDRRLREAEAKLEVATKALDTIGHMLGSGMVNAVPEYISDSLTRITAITQP